MNAVGATHMWLLDVPPAGCLICDGSALDKSVYPELYAVLGNRYGSTTTTFNLPDARGRFLRSVDADKGLDPSSASRTDRGDGLTGDVVGTLQGSALKRHRHAVMGGSVDGNYPGIHESVYHTEGRWFGYAGNPNETRPMNVSVSLVIQYEII